MKKLRALYYVFVCIMLLFFVTACGKSIEKRDASVVRKEQEIKKDKVTLVVYFSATGATKRVAERIAFLGNADIYEIVPKEPYSSSDLNRKDERSRAMIEMKNQAVRPEIAGQRISLDDYVEIFIGYPIWCGDAPRIISTFVETYDFDGKIVIPFCTSDGDGIEKSRDCLRELAGSGEWITGGRLDKNISDAELRKWMDELE